MAKRVVDNMTEIEFGGRKYYNASRLFLEKAKKNVCSGEQMRNEFANLFHSGFALMDGAHGLSAKSSINEGIFKTAEQLAQDIAHIGRDFRQATNLSRYWISCFEQKEGVADIRTIHVLDSQTISGKMIAGIALSSCLNYPSRSTLARSNLARIQVPYIGEGKVTTLPESVAVSQEDDGSFFYSLGKITPHSKVITVRSGLNNDMRLFTRLVQQSIPAMYEATTQRK